MNWFKYINNWYEKGYWTKSQVADAVVAGKITENEYETITGEAYMM